MPNKLIKRGEIWWIGFDQTTGHEQSGHRPAVIISVNAFNTPVIGMAIVVPGTTKEKIDKVTKQLFPDVIKVEPSKLNGLDKTTYFLGAQVRSVSTDRFDPAPCGILGAEELRELEDILIMIQGLAAN